MSRRIPIAAPLLLILAVVGPAAAQQSTQEWLDRCRERENDQRATHCEVREATMAAPSRLEVSAAPNGGIQVAGSDRPDVHVTARIQTWAESDAEAQAIAQQVQIETSGGQVRASGPRRTGERNQGWSVSFDVATPRQIDLDLETVNGGIGVTGVAGDLALATTNGGIHLEEVGGDVRAETTNGGMDVRLAGERWTGDGLELETTNGSISLTVPDGFAANLRASTVHGGIEVDFPVMVQGRIGRRVEAQLGAGGPPVHLATTNGGIEIRRR